MEESKFSTWKHSKILSTRLSPQARVGLLIHCRDNQPSVVKFTLVSLCLGVPSHRDVCALRVCGTANQCLCVFMSVEGFGRKRRQRRRNQSNAATKKEEENDTDTKNNVLSLSVFVSIPRSLTHAVVSTMITERWWQTSASQKLASRQSCIRENTNSSAQARFTSLCSYNWAVFNESVIINTWLQHINGNTSAWTNYI